MLSCYAPRGATRGTSGYRPCWKRRVQACQAARPRGRGARLTSGHACAIPIRVPTAREDALKVGLSLEPITLVTLLLAITAVILKAAVLVSVGLKPEVGSACHFAGALVLAAVVALTLSAIIAQAVAAVQGAAWRAVTTGTGVLINAPSRVRAALIDATSTQVVVESSHVITHSLDSLPFVREPASVEPCPSGVNNHFCQTSTWEWVHFFLRPRILLLSLLAVPAWCAVNTWICP